MKVTNGWLRYRLGNKSLDCHFIIGRKFSNNLLEIFSESFSEKEGERLKVTINPPNTNKKTPIVLEELLLVVEPKLEARDRVFLNGYQSWTESREYNLTEKIRSLNRLARPILEQYGDYSFYRGKRLHSWTYTYVRDRQNQLDFIGSLNEDTGFTIFEYAKSLHKRRNLVIKKDCGGLCLSGSYKAFDLYFSQGEEDEVFDRYFEVMKIPSPRVNNWVGWTSWYNYYTNVSEDDIVANLSAFRKRSIPIDCFQIDDGYQNAVGDWLCINDKFPKGMSFLAQRIKECGYKAGLWLAPFICEKKSQLFIDHQDWLARDEKGRLVRAGYNTNWTGFFYALDIYNPNVRDYLREVFDTVLNKWGYDLVKLDFLYAAALLPRSDKTGGQIMFEAMKFLRELVGEKLILGCGVPLGSAFGLVDYCRVGSDIALVWEDRALKNLNYRERVSTHNSIKNAIFRRHLNGRAFLNDPDVFILRKENNSLSTEQKYTLLLINSIFGGLLFTSDNIENYSDAEMELFMTVFPAEKKTIEKVLIDKVYMIYFTIKNRSYLALCNLEDEEVSLFLPERKDGKVYHHHKRGFLQGDSKLTLKPFESICLRACAFTDREL